MRVWCLMALLVPALGLAGCEAMSTMWGGSTRSGVSSSVVEFLYPAGEVPPKPTGEVPAIKLPITVGLAFVPGREGIGPLPEAQKMALLDQVRAKFTGEDYVTEIVLVPDTYLRGSNGFDALDRAARMYRLDVMALVSYDQLSTSSEKKSSFWYWTVVGAYLVEGTRNEVQTLVDTAVFDIPSRTLLFRAAGTDRVAKDSTMVESPQKLRVAQAASFGRAMDDMAANLQRELVAFKERVKEQKAPVRVVQRDDGAGGAGAWGIGGIALALLAVVRRRRAVRGVLSPEPADFPVNQPVERRS
jgi:rhombotail lipoprotein